MMLAACGSSTPRPIAIDTNHEACRRCRMIVSDPRLAAQIVAAADEPLIFDDLGCLRDHLASSPVPADAVIYVADHRTGEWVSARHAIFTRVPAASTPMGSHLVAHANAASRDADPVTRAGESVEVSAVVQTGSVP
jgi:copper chaperone NosL